MPYLQRSAKLTYAPYTLYIYTDTLYIYTDTLYIYTDTLYIYTDTLYFYTDTLYIYTDTLYIYTDTLYIYTDTLLLLSFVSPQETETTMGTTAGWVAFGVCLVVLLIDDTSSSPLRETGKSTIWTETLSSKHNVSYWCMLFRSGTSCAFADEGHAGQRRP